MEIDEQTRTLEAAMACLRGRDNAEIKRASAFIKKFNNKIVAGHSFFVLLCSSEDGLVRQLSGVMLRKKMVQMYNRCSPDQRAMLRSTLLGRVGEEAHTGARKAVVTCIAALAKGLMPGNNWPELTEALNSCVASGSTDLQTLAMVTCSEICDAMGTNCGVMIEVMLPWVEACIGLPDSKLQVASLRVAAYLLRFASEKYADRLRELLPAVVDITQAAMDRAVDQIVVESMDTLRAIVEEDSPVIHTCVVPLAQFFLSAISHERMEDSTKSEAAEALMSLMEVKPKTFMNEKYKLVDQVLPVVMHAIAQYDAETERENLLEARAAGVEVADMNDCTIWNVGGRILDTLAVQLPSSYVFKKLEGFLGTWLHDADPMHRHAALMALGIAAQGCHSTMAENLGGLLETIIATGEGDPHPLVREGEMFVLSQIAEYVNPTVLNYHDVIIPAVFRMMDVDKSHAVTEHACAVLENLVDGLEPHVSAMYLEQIMARLGEILTTPGQQIFVQEIAVATIASVASSAEHYLIPYLSGILDVLGPMLAHTDASLLRLRSAATEAVGFAAVAVGADAFRSFLPDLVLAVEDGFQYDTLELVEKTFVFYGCMAECFKDEFGAYVDKVFELADDHIRHVDALHVYDPNADEEDDEADAALGHLANDDDDEEEGHATGAGARPDAEGGDDTEEEEDDDDDDEYGARARYRAHTSTLDMQVAAIACIAQLAVHCKVAFVPHVTPSVELFKGMLQHFNPEIVEKCITALDNCILCMVNRFPLVRVLHGDHEVAYIAEEVQPVFDDIMTSYLLIMKSCRERRIVSTVCVAIQHLCKELGAAAIVNHHDAIMKLLFKIGKEKSACQLIYDDGEGGIVGNRALGEADDHETFADVVAAASFGGHHADEGDDEADHVGVVDEATDAIVEIARVMGDSFSVYLPNVMKIWRRYHKASRSAQDRLMAIGMYADLATALGDSFGMYVPQCLTAIADAYASQNKELQRNCVYAVGSFVAFCTDHARPASEQILAIISSACQLERGRAEADHLLDNGISALCKVIMHMPDAIPLGTVLPLLLAKLPIKADFAEAEFVSKCLLGLLHDHNPDAMPHFAEILALTCHDLEADTRVPRRVIDTVILPGLRAIVAAATPEVLAAARAVVEGLPAGHGRDTILHTLS